MYISPLRPVSETSSNLQTHHYIFNVYFPLFFPLCFNQQLLVDEGEDKPTVVSKP